MSTALLRRRRAGELYPPRPIVNDMSSPDIGVGVGVDVDVVK